LLRYVTDMDSSSLPGRVSWVENINWNLTVSPVYVINKGGVTMSLFGYISVCYVKPLEWAAGVEVSDLFHIFVRLGEFPKNLMSCAQKILNYGAK